MATAIEIQASESAALLKAQGWDGSCTYDLGAFHGDVDALAERLGREPMKDERIELEAAIRQHLDA